MKIQIRDATIVSLDETTMPETGGAYSGDVCIEDGRILALGAVPEGFRPDRTVEARGRIVMPGFVNCHTHLAMTLLRGYAEDLPLMEWLQSLIWPAESRHTGETIRVGTRLAVAEMIASGTTTALDMYFQQHVVAEVLLETGMRGVLSRAILSMDNNTREILDESIAMKERYAGPDRLVGVFLSGHAPYTCEAEDLLRIREAALAHDMGIHIHVSETRGEVEESLSRHGKTPVAYLADLGVFDAPTLAAHCVHVTPEDIGLLHHHGVSVAHNPRSNLKLASGIAPVSHMLRAGVNVGIGTDGAASNNTLDMVEETRLGVLLQKGVTGDATYPGVAQALRMATGNGARALGFPDLGVMRPGFRADLILVERKGPHLAPGHDPLTDLLYSAGRADVTHTMVAGRFLMEERVLTTIDTERLLSEAEDAARVLFPG